MPPKKKQPQPTHKKSEQKTTDPAQYLPTTHTLADFLTVAKKDDSLCGADIQQDHVISPYCAIQTSSRDHLGMGRFVVATQDIPTPGTTLFYEEPSVAVLTLDMLPTHCVVCGEPCTFDAGDGYNTNEQSDVMNRYYQYCTPTCQQSYHSFFAHEQIFIPYYDELAQTHGVSHDLVRMLIQYLILERLTKQENESHQQAKVTAANNMIIPSNITRIPSLVTHSSHISEITEMDVEQALTRKKRHDQDVIGGNDDQDVVGGDDDSDNDDVMKKVSISLAIDLHPLLEQLPNQIYHEDSTSDQQPAPSDNKKLLELSKQILSITGKFNANSHSIYQYTERGQQNQILGMGVYPNAAMFNHSCAPNCIFLHGEKSDQEHIFSKRTLLAIKTIRPIVRGEMLTIPYTTLNSDIFSRKYDLLLTKSFYCQCNRCALTIDMPPPPRQSSSLSTSIYDCFVGNSYLRETVDHFLKHNIPLFQQVEQFILLQEQEDYTDYDIISELFLSDYHPIVEAVLMQFITQHFFETQNHYKQLLSSPSSIKAYLTQDVANPTQQQVYRTKEHHIATALPQYHATVLKVNHAITTLSQNISTFFDNQDNDFKLDSFFSQLNEIFPCGLYFPTFPQTQSRNQHEALTIDDFDYLTLNHVTWTSTTRGTTATTHKLQQIKLKYLFKVISTTITGLKENVYDLLEQMRQEQQQKQPQLNTQQLEQALTLFLTTVYYFHPPNTLYYDQFDVIQLYYKYLTQFHSPVKMFLQNQQSATKKAINTRSKPSKATVDTSDDIDHLLQKINDDQLLTLHLLHHITKFSFSTPYLTPYLSILMFISSKLTTVQQQCKQVMMAENKHNDVAENNHANSSIAAQLSSHVQSEITDIVQVLFPKE